MTNLSPDSMAENKSENLDFYHEPKDSASSGMTRDEVRNIVLAELKNFRDYMASDWGGLGSGNSVGGTGLYGFFSKQSFGSYYQSPHAVQSTVVNPTGSNAGDPGTTADGNDFGRIFIDKYNDRVAALPTGARTGAQKSPSWIFDLPQWAQKAIFESTGPGIYYTTRTGAFTNGLVITGGTSGAKATITAIFVDAADSTKGTLYTSLIGTTNFTAGEVITDTSTGSATISSRTYLSTNGILRLYGVGGQEVRTDSTTVCFDKWGAVDFFTPYRYFTWEPSFGFDPETFSCFAQEGFTYVRLDNLQSFNTQTANFTVGQTLTGGTSGATGIILSQVDAGTSGTLTLSNITGTFQNAEIITDGAGGSATATNTALASPTVLRIYLNGSWQTII